MIPVQGEGPGLHEAGARRGCPAFREGPHVPLPGIRAALGRHALPRGDQRNLLEGGAQFAFPGHGGGGVEVHFAEVNEARQGRLAVEQGLGLQVIHGGQAGDDREQSRQPQPPRQLGLLLQVNEVRWIGQARCLQHHPLGALSFGLVAPGLQRGHHVVAQAAADTAVHEVRHTRQLGALGVHQGAVHADGAEFVDEHRHPPTRSDFGL